MVKRYLFAFCTLSLLLLVSCSPKLVGTWEIANYEHKTVGGQDIKVRNIGTMTFDKGNMGVKEINYSVLANKISDTAAFEWSAEEGTVTIKSDGSNLSKTWIVLDGSRKYQKWKSTDGANTIQTIELKKQKKK